MVIQPLNEIWGLSRTSNGTPLASMKKCFSFFRFFFYRITIEFGYTIGLTSRQQGKWSPQEMDDTWSCSQWKKETLDNMWHETKTMKIQVRMWQLNMGGLPVGSWSTCKGYEGYLSKVKVQHHWNLSSLLHGLQDSKKRLENFFCEVRKSLARERTSL